MGACGHHPKALHRFFADSPSLRQAFGIQRGGDGKKGAKHGEEDATRTMREIFD
jgi:hypothetical protein